jgi:LPXTG-motif cell wall-anchored protein
MDNVTMIRVVAGVLLVILLGILIARRKRMASTKRVTPRK